MNVNNLLNEICAGCFFVFLFCFVFFLKKKKKKSRFRASREGRMPINGLVPTSLPIWRTPDMLIGLFRIIIHMARCGLGQMLQCLMRRIAALLGYCGLEKSPHSRKYAISELCERIAADLDSACGLRPGTSETLRTNKLSHFFNGGFFLALIFRILRVFPYQFQLTPE